MREFLFAFFFLVVAFVYFVLLFDSDEFVFLLIFMGDVSSGIFFLCYIFITF